MKRIVVVVLMVGALLAKSAAAFVPVPLLFAPPVVATATGLALSTWAAIAAGVGLLLFSVSLRDNNGNEFMKVRVNPNAPADVPAGWSVANPPSADPVPPSTAGAPTTMWTIGNRAPQPSLSAACADWLQFKATDPASNPGAPYIQAGVVMCTCNVGSFGVWWEYPAPNNRPCDQSDGGNAGALITANSSVTCPAGYANSGGVCTLSTPTAVRFPPDNKCGLKISGGVMSYDNRDPDCDGPPAGMLSTDGKTLTVTQGAQRVQVQINPDNTVSVTQWSPTSSGNTQIDTVKTGDPASSGSSIVKSASQSTTTATGDAAFQQAPSPTSPNFPDDYARDASVQAGNAQLSQINNRLSDIKTQLSTDGVTPSDPSSRTQSDIEAIFFSGTFDALRGWTMPARSVVCPTWQFSIWGQSYTLNSHCGLIENQRATVSTICLLMFALIALFIVLGA